MLWLAFGVPLAYLGLVLATTTHCGGHALIGQAFFEGVREEGRMGFATEDGEPVDPESSYLWESRTLASIRIGIDGTGEASWAWWQVSEPISVTPEDTSMPALLRGSGLMSTTVLGWALVLLGWLLRRRPLVSFALVALGMAHVLDAPLAMLWGGVFPSRAGVVAVLLTQSEMAWLRIPVILGGGGLMLIVVAVTVTSLFRRVGETLGPLSRTQATLVVSTIATMASLLVGCQYRAAGGLTLVAVALVAVPIAALGVRLVRQRRRDVAPLSLLRWNWALAVSSAWAAAGIVAAVLVLSGLHDGIEFG